jgi:hypothetical protein
MEMISTCVYNTNFQFEGTFYEQTLGMAIGPPLSHILCYIYMDHLEYEAIRTFDSKPLLFLRCADDIYAEWPDIIFPVEDFLQY